MCHPLQPKALLAALVVICAPLSLATTNAADETARVKGVVVPPDVIGEAFHQTSGSLLYRELYFCDDLQLQCTVEYRGENGEMFASKAIDYRDSRRAPSLQLQDFRNDKVVELDSVVDAELVIDAGFDNYVRQRWDELARGEEVVFPFLVVGREEPIDMRASLAQEKPCQPAQLCLEIRLNSWLLGMVVDPIHLVYDRERQRLLQFSGVSNLRDAAGKSQSVDIRYSYPDTAPGHS